MRVLSLLTIVLALLSARDTRAQLNVMTTTTDLADLVRTIGGEFVTVDAFCKANQDPHYVQTRPSLIVKLRKADLVVAVGLDLEAGWLPLVIRGARNPKIRPGTPGHLDLSQWIEPLAIPANANASQGHLHPRGNPHYWLDPVRMAALVPHIADRLSTLDSAHTASFKGNAQAFTRKLRTKIQSWDAKMNPYRGTEVLGYHDTFTYFHACYGLKAVGTLENKPGIPPSPRHLSQVIAKAKQQRVPVIFHEAFHDKKPSGLVADRSGAILLVLPVSVGAVPGADNYIALIDNIVDQFIAAMAEHRRDD